MERNRTERQTNSKETILPARNTTTSRRNHNTGKTTHAPNTKADTRNRKATTYTHRHTRKQNTPGKHHPRDQTPTVPFGPLELIFLGELENQWREIEKAISN